MIGTHKFQKGQRVQFTQAGREARLRPKEKYENHGTVIRVDNHNFPTVKWDDRKTNAGPYHPGFIEPTQ